MTETKAAAATIVVAKPHNGDGIDAVNIVANAAANGAKRVPTHAAGRTPLHSAPRYRRLIAGHATQAPAVIDQAKGLACVPGVAAHSE